jgi:hypothetical protein
MRLASVIPFALALTLAGGALPSQLRAQQPEPQPQLQAPQQEAPQPKHTRIVTGGDQWGANYFPNYELTNQDGKVFKFFDDMIKDKVVLISFIYTNCPDACPLETARIAQVQGILGDRVGKDVHFYSITIDPKNDTVEVLREYAQRYQAGPGWQFFTGNEAQIAKLRMKLGLYDASEGTELQNHGLNIIIGNQSTGRWMRSGPFENPYVLARQIGDWLHNWKLPPTAELDYKNAPKLRKVSDGETLFRTRCSSCHAVGGANAALAKLGPNLFGVTDRRERTWLRRWLMEPDVMLAEKDPIAMPMFEAYNKVAMPNMRLSEQDAEDVLLYLEEESRRAATVLPTLTNEKGEEREAKASCCEKSDNVVVGDETSEPEDEEPVAAGNGTLRPFAWFGAAIGLALGAFALRRFRSN